MKVELNKGGGRKETVDCDSIVVFGAGDKPKLKIHETKPMGQVLDHMLHIRPIGRIIDPGTTIDMRD